MGPIPTHWLYPAEFELSQDQLYYLDKERTIQRILMKPPPSPLSPLLRHANVSEEEGVIQIIVVYATPTICLDEQIFQLSLELDYSYCIRYFTFFPYRDVRKTTVSYDNKLGYIIYERHQEEPEILLTYPQFQGDILPIVQYIRQDIFKVSNPLTDPIVIKFIRQLKLGFNP
jgi:hypothetical protein